jgi:hypothetical protein
MERFGGLIAKSLHSLKAALLKAALLRAAAARLSG